MLDITTIRQRYADPYGQLKRQSAWVIKLARLLDPVDKHGRPRTARQVKQDVKEFLDHLEQEAAEHPAAAEVSAGIVKAVRHRWWGLFTCYQITNVPSSNNDLETFFKNMKHHQRRITGRKSVHDFILRYGSFAAFIDYAESVDELLMRFRQVKPNDFNQARQALRKVEMRLKKLYRFRHHPDEYYRDLEIRWEKAISSS